MEAATEVRTVTRRPRGGSLEAVAPAVAATAMLLIVAGCLVVVVGASQPAAFLSPSLHAHPAGWLNWPFGGLGRWHPSDRMTLQWLLLAVLLAMTACYGVALWLAERLSQRFVVGVVIAVYAIFLLSPPLLLTDVFNYVEYARMGVDHGLNPYTQLAIHVFHDPVRVLSNWHHLRSPYGPLFTLMMYALAPLGLAGAYWGYKVLLFAASLGCLWLVAAIARRLGIPPIRAVILVGLNPLVLLYGAGGQHNDMFTLLPILAGLYLLIGRRESLGGASFVAAAVTKASAVLLVPIAIAAGPRRLRSLAGAAVAALVLGGASLLAFGPNLPAIDQQSRLVTSFSMPNVMGYVLGQGGETSSVRLICQALLATAVVACTAYAWRSRDALAPLGWLTVATIATLGWDMPWYLLWLLPFIALVRGRAFRIAAVFVAVWLTVQWLPQVPREVAKAAGFNPLSTKVGKSNRAYLMKLLH
jgi:hypothetical protein